MKAPQVGAPWGMTSNTPAFNKGAIALSAADHCQAGHDPLLSSTTFSFQEPEPRRLRLVPPWRDAAPRREIAPRGQ